MQLEDPTRGKSFNLKISNNHAKHRQDAKRSIRYPHGACQKTLRA